MVLVRRLELLRTNAGRFKLNQILFADDAVRNLN